jgi:hypothetical protein
MTTSASARARMRRPSCTSYQPGLIRDAPRLPAGTHSETHIENPCYNLKEDTCRKCNFSTHLGGTNPDILFLTVSACHRLIYTRAPFAKDPA